MNRITTEDGHYIADLMKRGFKAAWIKDLQVGDIFVIAPMFSFDPRDEIYVVEEIFSIDASYFDEEQADIIPHTVVSMIVTDDLGLERHLSYSHSYDVYIYRGALS